MFVMVVICKIYHIILKSNEVMKIHITLRAIVMEAVTQYEFMGPGKKIIVIVFREKKSKPSKSYAVIQIVADKITKLRRFVTRFHSTSKRKY